MYFDLAENTVVLSECMSCLVCNCSVYFHQFHPFSQICGMEEDMCLLSWRYVPPLTFMRMLCFVIFQFVLFLYSFNFFFFFEESLPCKIFLRGSTRIKRGNLGTTPASHYTSALHTHVTWLECRLRIPGRPAGGRWLAAILCEYLPYLFTCRYCAWPPV